MNNDTETLLRSNPFKNQTEQVGTQHVNKPGTSQMTLENVEDFTNVCRSCATVTELVIPIYAGEGLQNNLADKIVTYLPIEVSEDDDLPQVVCYQCASTLIAWHEFVQCSMQSDTALKTKLDTLRVKQNEVDHGKSFIIEAHGKFKDPTGFDDDSNMICEYCGVEQSEEDYPEHLITMHSEQLLPSREHDPFQYVMSDDDDAEEEPARKPKKAARAKKSKQAKPKKPKNTEPAERSRKSKKFKAKSRNKKETTRKSDNKPTNSEVNSSHNNQQDKDPIASAPTVSEDLADGTPLQICEASQQIEVLMESVERIKVNKKKKRYRCTHCPREFRIPSSYSYHFRSVHGNYYYECDDCGKKFRNKQILAQHTTVHDKMRHKQCKYCQKRFRTRANLYTHEQTHIDLNLKKWQCNECDRGFRWRTHLLRHMKRHSSDKSLVCLTCGRRFNIECDLRRHMLTHGSGNFNCRKCNSRFSQLRYLRVHMQKKHDEIIDGN